MMKILNLTLLLTSLSVYSHGTALDNINSTFLLIQDKENNVLNIHNHSNELTVTKSIRKALSFDSSEGKSLNDSFFEKERSAIPNGFFMLEFVNEYGAIMHISPVAAIKAYASHYDAFLPEELPERNSVIPVQLPGNQNIAGLNVYLKINEETYSEMGSFDLDLKAYKDPNKITNIFGD